MIDHDRACDAAIRLGEALRLQDSENPRLLPIIEGYGIQAEVLEHLIQHAIELAPWLDVSSFLVGLLLTLITTDYCPDAQPTDKDFDELLK